MALIRKFIADELINLWIRQHQHSIVHRSLYKWPEFQHFPSITRISTNFLVRPPIRNVNRNRTALVQICIIERFIWQQLRKSIIRQNRCSSFRSLSQNESIGAPSACDKIGKKKRKWTRQRCQNVHRNASGKVRRGCWTNVIPLRRSKQSIICSSIKADRLSAAGNAASRFTNTNSNKKLDIRLLNRQFQLNHFGSNDISSNQRKFVRKFMQIYAN